LLIAASGLTLLAAGCGSSLPDPESPGARLYAQRCVGCHRLYQPGTLTPAMWQYQVDRMQEEFARRGLPPLSAAEQELLLGYLTAHSGGGGTAGAGS
jgi:hypothetical protein